MSPTVSVKWVNEITRMRGVIALLNSSIYHSKPGYALLSVVTLRFEISANKAFFSVVDSQAVRAPRDT